MNSKAVTAVFLVTLGLRAGTSPATWAEQASNRDLVRQAFSATHDGWSSDEVLVNDELNQAFLKKCRELKLTGKDADLNWLMLNLRKAGKLQSQVTRRRRDSHDDYRHAAEIAARLLSDKHRQSVDRVLCDPNHRSEFDEVAKSIAEGVDPYLLRKAAIGLRKARRLQPELVIRIADWGREIITLPAGKIRENPDSVPAKPGIYIFRDDSGYLYVGESKNLRARVKKHLDQSDRTSLANYLTINAAPLDKTVVEIHSFDPKSKASQTSVRRAYESELIRSRRPRFNIRP